MLFLLGTLQALVPYLLFIYAAPSQLDFMLSYYPLAIWIIGYVCFWIGTRLGPRKMPKRGPPPIPVSMSLLKLSLLVLCVISLAELYGLTRVYGGIPLLAFASGKFGIGDVNESQTQSGFGQIGAAGVTVFVLVGVISLLAIKARQRKIPISRWTLSTLSLAFFLAVFGGKRQGIFMCLAVIGCCSVIVFGSPTDLVGSFMPWKLKRRGGVVVSVVLLLCVFEAISGLLSLRTGGNVTRSTLEELTLYYEWPIMNMSAQCIEVGFGPKDFKPLGPFQSLLPAKMGLDRSLFGTNVPKYEPSSPSGFYERLQWDLGLWGIIPFNVLCGMSAQWMYRMAFRRYAALLTYAFMAWALFSAALYNHFLNLLFLPFPAFIFFVASFVNRGINRSHVGSYKIAKRGVVGDSDRPGIETAR